MATAEQALDDDASDWVVVADDLSMKSLESTVSDVHTSRSQPENALPGPWVASAEQSQRKGPANESTRSTEAISSALKSNPSSSSISLVPRYDEDTFTVRRTRNEFLSLDSHDSNFLLEANWTVDAIELAVNLIPKHASVTLLLHPEVVKTLALFDLLCLRQTRAPIEFNCFSRALHHSLSHPENIHRPILLEALTQHAARNGLCADVSLLLSRILPTRPANRDLHQWVETVTHQHAD